MQKSGEVNPLKEFDDVSTQFQARFRYRDQRGRNRTHSNFAASTVEQRAQQLGEPWESDYKLLYCLASMHAHGAPGAVIHQHFVQQSASPQNKEKDSTALVAFMAIKILVDDVHLLVRQQILRDSNTVDAVFRAVQLAISKTSGS